MSVSAPSRTGRSESRAYYSDDNEYDYGEKRRRRRDVSRHERAKRHENCEDGTCAAIEKKYGGFSWEEGVTLALIGGLALFNFDKAYEKHKQRSEEREEKERKEQKRREDSHHCSHSPSHRASTFPRRSMDDSRSRGREMDRERSKNRNRRGTVHTTSAASDRGDDYLYHADQRHQRDMRRDSRRERYRSSEDWQRDRDQSRR